ncbi:MAG TPA: sulfotransferase [Stellaceae bacterium]|nr:sulfotransferase [Stellaceae bacterium]
MTELAVDRSLGTSLAERWSGGFLTAFAGAADLFRARLSADELIRLAQRQTGLSDFGEWEVEDALEILVKSYEEEANLSAFGRMAVRWDLVRFLSNLLRFQAREKQDPSILSEQIERPIFITGLPRSGTSFLHQLLCEDPANRAIRCWEPIYPFPLDRCSASDRDRRRRKVDRQLAIFARMTPEVRALHPVTADSPQECTEITGHVLRSMRFDTTHHIPTYRDWLHAQDQMAPYRFHKRFLQHMQHGRAAKRWVLKCPDHVFALDALRAVYPDACIVFMHRDPIVVLASLAKLTETLRRPFTRELDRRQIGADLSRRWAQGAAILVDAATSCRNRTGSALHLEFGNFTRDPAAAIEPIYRHFRLDLDANARARMRALVARKPKGGYGRNDGRLEDYGLDQRELQHRFADYMEIFQRR